jgi:hypothetical protein
MRECSWPKAFRCWREEGSSLNRFPERSWIESPVALRQRLDRYKPTLITNGNLYKIAHSEPTVDGPAFATLRDRHADAQGRELQWDEQLASPCSAIQVEAIFCAGRFDKLIQRLGIFLPAWF